MLEVVDLPRRRRRGRGRSWIRHAGDRAQLHRHLPALAASTRCASRPCSARRRPAWSRRSARASTRFKVGDRVAYAGQAGAYAESHAGRRRPRGAACRTASQLRGRRRGAAQGHDGRVPAAPLLSACRPARPSWSMPPPAGSARSWCNGPKALGATVIGTVGSDAKADARPRLRLRPRDPLPRTRTSRRGCARSPAARACRSPTTRSARTPSRRRWPAWRGAGMFVSFGNASGPAPAVRAAAPDARRLAVLHPPDAVRLHRDPRGARRERRRRSSRWSARASWSRSRSARPSRSRDARHAHEALEARDDDRRERAACPARPGPGTRIEGRKSARAQVSVQPQEHEDSGDTAVRLSALSAALRALRVMDWTASRRAPGRVSSRVQHSGSRSCRASGYFAAAAW